MHVSLASLMRVLPIVSLLNLAVFLTACAPEDPGMVSTRRPDGGDEDRDGGGGRGGGGGDDITGNGGSRGNACESFDPDKVHLWGLDAENAHLLTPPVDGIVNELDDTWICTLREDASLPKVHPLDHRIYYRQGARSGGPTRLVAFEVDASGEPILEDSLVQTEEFPTTGCDGSVSMFHFHPETGEYFYNCAFSDDRPPLAGLFKDQSIDFDGPWFDETGVEITMESVFAVGRTSLLVADTGFVGLGILPYGESTVIPVTYDGEEEIVDPENLVLAVRTHEDGFRVMVGGLDSAYSTRRLMFVDANGEASEEGIFPHIDRMAVSLRALNPQSYNYALDAEGQLYEDQLTSIIVSNIDGDQGYIYDKRESRVGLRGGYAPFLITGP